MNYKLIMLPNPLLVSDEEIKEGELFYSFFDSVHRTLRFGKMVIPFPNDKKIIAGIEGLPKLDLSLIAEEIGWVDVEKLAREYSGIRSAQSSSVDTSLHNARLAAFKEGYKTNQSLNENKYTLADIENAFNSGRGYGNPDDIKDFNSFFKSLSKPKEYNVEVEMEDMLQTRHGVQWHDLPNQKEGRETDGIYQTVKRIKTTNNTIKVTKILS